MKRVHFEVRWSDGFVGKRVTLSAARQLAKDVGVYPAYERLGPPDIVRVTVEDVPPKPRAKRGGR